MIQGSYAGISSGRLAGARSKEVVIGEYSVDYKEVCWLSTML